MLKSLIEFVTSEGRVSPNPQKWESFYQLAKNEISDEYKISTGYLPVSSLSAAIMKAISDQSENNQ